MNCSLVLKDLLSENRASSKSEIMEIFVKLLLGQLGLTFQNQEIKTCILM